MRSLVAVSLIVALTLHGVGAQTAPDGTVVPGAPLRSRLIHDVIKGAVKDTLAGDKKDQKQSQETVLGAERYENFARDFSDAKLPDCLHPDGLKHQPTFFLSGVYALPFVLVAAVRGKCN